MTDYEQMEMDVTLKSDHDLKENVQTSVKFALNLQMQEYQNLTSVKNRYEGYGIVAEEYSVLQSKIKSTKTDMNDLLKLLPNGDGDVLNVVGSLYNSSIEVAMEAIKLAAQSQRIMNALYYGESSTTPLEEYLEETTKEQQDKNEGFEDAPEAESEE